MEVEQARLANLICLQEENGREISDTDRGRMQSWEEIEKLILASSSKRDVCG